jgi:uncharacterized protein YndB with AHSA1/START domain
MSKIKVWVVIDEPPERVWAEVEDISGHVRWMADAEAIRFTSSQRSGVGTTFDCDTRFGPFKLTDKMAVTEWKPGKSMGVRHEGVVTGSGRFTLRKVRGGRTRFTWEERLTFPRWMGGRFGAIAAKPVMGWVWARNLNRLKALAER